MSKFIKQFPSYAIKGVYGSTPPLFGGGVYGVGYFPYGQMMGSSQGVLTINLVKIHQAVLELCH